MNARQAVEQNEILTVNLMLDSMKMARLRNISFEEALAKKVAVYVKYAKNDTERVAWEIRGKNAYDLA